MLSGRESEGNHEPHDALKQERHDILGVVHSKRVSRRSEECADSYRNKIECERGDSAGEHAGDNDHGNRKEADECNHERG